MTTYGPYTTGQEAQMDADLQATAPGAGDIATWNGVAYEWDAGAGAWNPVTPGDPPWPGGDPGTVVPAQPPAQQQPQQPQQPPQQPAAGGGGGTTQQAPAAGGGGAAAGGQAAAATATEWVDGGTTWQDPYGPIQEATVGGWTTH